MSGTQPAVGVFVTRAQAELMAGQDQGLARVLLLVRPVPLDDPLPRDTLEGLSAAIVEVDPGERKSVERLVKLARANPGLPLIAAIAAPDVALVRTLVREGVADVVSLPIEVAELNQVCLEALARRAQPATRTRLAPLVAVVRSSGACGATTIATNLACELAAQDWNGRGAVLGDLDLQFGNAGTYLNVARSGSFTELLEARDRLDAELLKSLTGVAANGLAVISAPDHITSMESVEVDALLDVVEQLRGHYGLVVLDFPANWTNWTASVAVAADIVLLVTELSVASMRQARRCIDLFDTIGVERDRVKLVANKVEKRLFRSISVDDLTNTLDRPVLGIVPLDAAAVAAAQDQGLLVSQVARKSKFVAGIAELAGSLRELLLREDHA